MRTRVPACSTANPAWPRYSIWGIVRPSGFAGLRSDGQRVREGLDHPVHLLLGHLRVERQREALPADPLGHGEVARLVSQILVRRLEVDRNGVVQTRLDALPLQLDPD